MCENLLLKKAKINQFLDRKEIKEKATLVSSKNIKDLRIDARYTKKYLCKILNVSISTYNRYESGKTIINIKVLKTLAKFYNVSADYILGLNDENT